MTNVNSTPEATYVRSLAWDFDGYHWICKGVTETVKDKLSEVFTKWGIGHHGDRLNCKGNTMNVNVTPRQFLRVQFSFDTAPTEEKACT